MMNARRLRSLLGLGVAFLSAMAISVAQVHTARPVDGPGNAPARATAPPQGVFAAPAAAPTSGAPVFVQPIMRLQPRKGDVVPLALLPRLPARTSANTITRRGDIRRMSADGSTILIRTTGSCSANSGTIGAFYNTGCTVQWGSSSLPAAGAHHYIDYTIAPNSSTAVAASGNYTGAGSAYGDSTTLATAGMWVFATFDVTAGLWETVVYVNVQSSGTIQVFQDQYHNLETYQYDVNSSGFAYIYVTNVAAGDNYTVYVEYTSKNPYCVFSSPAQGSYPTNALCTPTVLTGTLSANGTLSVTWPISNTLPAGTYSVSVYDNTLNQRLNEVQVSLIGGNGLALQIRPDGTNANPSPRPLPAFNQTTAIAWDDSGDQSASGAAVKTVASFPNHSYTWTLHAPDGSVNYKTTATASGTLSAVLPFTNIFSPGNYPSKVFTATLYDNTTNLVQASQSFTVLGYNVLTQFDSSGTYSASLAMGGGASVAAGLKFTNMSNVQFGTGNGDNISKILFTTGQDYKHTSSAGNFGMTARLNGFTQAQCFPSCSSTATDSAGNVWNVTLSCSAAANGPNEECDVLLVPQSSTVSLAPGATIEVTNITFTNNSGNTCTSQPQGACLGQTIVYPTHGLTWSVNTEQSATAPVYFAAGNSTHSGTAAIVLAGECTGPPGGAITCNSNAAEAHFYPERELQGMYQRTSPYNLTTSYWDYFKITINNTSASSNITTVALGMPGAFGAANTIQNIETGPNASANWGNTGTCPANSGLNPSIYICWTAQNGHKIGPGASDTIDFLENPTVSSFPYQDASIEAAAPNQFVLTPTASNLQVYAQQPLTNVDSQAIAVYSLNGNLMNASFSPSQIGQNTPSAPVSIVFQNTSLGQDPFPDYVDAIVMSFPNSYSILAPTATGATGWASQGASWANGATTNYLFGLCAAQNTNGTATPPPTTPLSAVPNAVPGCAAATEQADSLAPGATVSLNFNLQNINTNSSVTFNVYAHGANGGGWTGPIAATLTATPTSGNSGFSKINGTAVPTNTEPQVAQDSNVYQYTFKNTSASTSVTEVKIGIPATDVSGLTAAQLNASPWNVTTPSIISGCATPTFATTQPSGSTNGTIDITGCTIPAGSSLVVQFTATNPSVQNDEWAWPAVINPGSVTAGETWQTDSRVKVIDTLGLTVVVDPSAPGPGSSNPTVNCPTCAFSGTTIDFGNPAANTQTQYADVARASVYAVSSAHSNWVLCMEANQNPASTYGGQSYELQASTDAAASTPTSQGTAYFNTAFAAVPYSGQGVSQFKIATGPFTTTAHNPYDAIQSFQLSIGIADPLSPHLVTLTYTLLSDTTVCPAS